MTNLEGFKDLFGYRDKKVFRVKGDVQHIGICRDSWV